jgi:hypothetical protein
VGLAVTDPDHAAPVTVQPSIARTRPPAAPSSGTQPGRPVSPSAHGRIPAAELTRLN